ncbi:MAG TPA: hypothetical protein VM597_04870 [Gemmataceae bacterium]|jgi:hypothetical protein|nr:hypothetical protein [Gemmataceae bacterium]
MSRDPSPGPPASAEDAVLAYLREVDAGVVTDPAAFLAAHPDMAGELERFFTAERLLRGRAGPASHPLARLVEPSTGQAHRLDGKEKVLVGRSREADVPVRDRSCSRTHFELASDLATGRWSVRALTPDTRLSRVWTAGSPSTADSQAAACSFIPRRVRARDSGAKASRRPARDCRLWTKNQTARSIGSSSGFSPRAARGVVPLDLGERDGLDPAAEPIELFRVLQHPEVVGEVAVQVVDHLRHPVRALGEEHRQSPGVRLDDLRRLTASWVVQAHRWPCRCG